MARQPRQFALETDGSNLNGSPGRAARRLGRICTTGCARGVVFVPGTSARPPLAEYRQRRGRPIASQGVVYYNTLGPAALGKRTTSKQQDAVPNYIRVDWIRAPSR